MTKTQKQVLREITDISTRICSQRCLLHNNIINLKISNIINTLEELRYLKHDNIPAIDRALHNTILCVEELANMILGDK